MPRDGGDLAEDVLDFDATMDELARIVKELENPSSLEKSLELYEIGVSLARKLDAKLTDAERRVASLTESSAAPSASRSGPPPPAQPSALGRRRQGR